MFLLKTFDFTWACVLENYMIKCDFMDHEVSVKIWCPWLGVATLRCLKGYYEYNTKLALYQEK
jgi:hypothetical protein